MDEQSKQDLTIWALFYGGLVAMQFHPRNAGVAVDLQHFATVADHMMEFYKTRKLREDTQWLSP